jgi:tetratricopeptide (TPR) repeat protein
MPILSAENAFRKGLGCLSENRPKEASEFFRTALELERQRSKSRLDMRYLSYYGLSLARAGLSTQIALQACRSAASRQYQDPVLLLNLGRVYLLTGRVSPALEAFERGLAISPDHKILLRERAQIDRRQRPVVPFLGRNSTINRWLGRVRASRRGRTAAVGYAGISSSPQ